jgi:hypothetical protein
MLGQPMATPVTALFQTDAKRQPTEYASPAESDAGAFSEPGQPGIVGVHPIAPHGRRSVAKITPDEGVYLEPRAAVRSFVPLEVETDVDQVVSPLYAAKSGHVSTKQDRILSPGVHFEAPSSRVMVIFDFGRFFRTLWYHMFFPFTLPILLCKEGRVAARNMAFLVNPLTPSGFGVWCVVCVNVSTFRQLPLDPIHRLCWFLPFCHPCVS